MIDCIRLWQITWKHEWSRYLIPMSDECVTASTVECSLCFCPPRKSKTHHQRIYVFNFSLHLYRDLTDTQRQTLRFYLWSCDEQTHSHIFKLYTHINRHTHFIRIRSGLMWPHTYTSVYCFFAKGLTVKATGWFLTLSCPHLSLLLICLVFMFFLCLLSQLLGPASCSSNGDHRAAVSAAGGPGHGGYQGHKRYHDGGTALPVNPVSPRKPTI